MMKNGNSSKKSEHRVEKLNGKRPSSVEMRSKWNPILLADLIIVRALRGCQLTFPPINQANLILFIATRWRWWIFFLVSKRRSFFSRPSFATHGRMYHGVEFKGKGLIKSDYVLCGSSISVKWTVIIEHRLLGIRRTNWNLYMTDCQMHHMKQIQNCIVSCLKPNPSAQPKKHQNECKRTFTYLNFRFIVWTHSYGDFVKCQTCVIFTLLNVCRWTFKLRLDDVSRLQSDRLSMVIYG